MLDGLRLRLERRLNKLLGQMQDSSAAALPTSPALPVVEENPLLQAHTLLAEGKLMEARIVLRRAATAGTPQAFEAFYLLGQISEQQKDFDDAKRQYIAALESNPDYIPACESTTRLMLQTGEESQILPFLQARVAQSPQNPQYHLLLARLFENRSHFEGVVKHLTAAVELGIHDARTYLKLGAALCRLMQETQAIPYFERALALDSSLAYEVYFHRGEFHLHHGDAQQGVAFLEQTIDLQPLYGTPYSLLLLELTHSAKALNRSYAEVAQRFGQAFSAFTPALEPRIHLPPAGEHRVLRVGFVGGEFRNHPLYFFLNGVLRHLDKTRIHATAFSNNKFDDSITFECKALFDAWNDIAALADSEVCTLIQNQKIDVLMDLSGHSGDRRLSVFARKPAPVQVAWLGYFASTGLQTMDYILADHYCVPENSEPNHAEWFSEKVFYLPATRLCMNIPTPSRPIAVAPPPCLANGYVTFGSYQQVVKLNAAVLQLWSKVLAAVPQSRLRLQTQAFHLPAERDKIAARLTEVGIDLARVELRGSSHWEEYLESHAEVDILLDTFPYTGGTTTTFALWMGVPTLTLRGDTMLSLQGVSMLSCVGLTDWIADDTEAYLALAMRHARNPAALAQLRSQLRATAEQSPLFDTLRFSRDFTEALWAMCHEKAQAQAQSPALLRAQGNALLAEGKLAEAATYFRQGLQYAPNDMPLLICLGYTLKELAQWDEARTLLNHAAQSGSAHPDAVDALYLLGQISEQQGDLDDAKRQYTAALTCKPDFEPARSDMLRLSQPQP